MQPQLLSQFIKILTPLTVLIVIAGAYDYHSEMNNMRNEIAAEESAHLTYGMVMLDNDLKAVALDLQVLAGHPELSDMDTPLTPEAGEHLKHDFILLLKSKQLYDQARFIDEAGMEMVRVNFNGKIATAVPRTQLQPKKNRYYFRNTIELDKGEIYVSPLDLNIEHGEVERPIKPMIRMSTPVFDHQGRKGGIVILNYRADKLLRDFDVGLAGAPGTGMIVNAEGYWLRGPTPEMEWGFMLGHDETFPKHYPSAWSHITSAESGQFENGYGLFSYATLYPTRDSISSNGINSEKIKGKQYYWKVVSLVPAQVFAGASIATAKKVAFTFGALYGIVAIIAGMLAQARANALRADAAQREGELLTAKTHLLMEQVASAANESNTIFDAMQVSLESVCAYTGWPVGHYYALADDGTGELTSTDIWHITNTARFEAIRKVNENTRFALGEGLPGRVLESGEPTWVPDVTKDDNYLRAKLTDNIGVRAGFAFPILIGKNVVGVLEFYTTKSIQPDLALLEIMADIGTQLGRIVERQRAQELLRNIQKMHEKAQSLAHLGHWSVNFSDNKLNWSEETYRLFEQDPERLDVTYDAFTDVVHPDDREFVAKAFSDSIRDKTPYDIKHRLLMKDGRVKWVREQCETFYDNDGNPVHSIGTVLDITKIKDVEHELIQAKEVADAANMAKSTFLSSMSHELRTPLNAILGFAQLLEYNPKEPLSTAQIDSVHRIINGGEHLLKLIDEVLNLARIEAGKVELSIEKVAPGGVLEECVHLVRSMAEKRDITIDVETGSEELPAIFVDILRYKQVLLNLMTNAIKYNHDGGEVRVMMRKQADGMLRASISDTGPGIPEGRKSELFQPFNRLGAEVTEIEGTGIGLTITKQLVKIMGGRIGFESEEGRGSVFWIDMPLMTEEVAGADDAGAAQDETGKSFPPIDGAVLYVEDNPANLELMEQIVLQVPGLEMITARNAELGLELAESRRPDLIILDINLPGMDGFKALGKLRENDVTKDIPVIALSASAMQCDYEKGVAAGFDRYLTKPIKVGEMVESIRQQIAATE